MLLQATSQTTCKDSLVELISYLYARELTAQKWPAK